MGVADLSHHPSDPTEFPVVHPQELEIVVVVAELLQLLVVAAIARCPMVRRDVLDLISNLPNRVSKQKTTRRAIRKLTVTEADDHPALVIADHNQLPTEKHDVLDLISSRLTLASNPKTIKRTIKRTTKKKVKRTIRTIKLELIVKP